MNQYDELTRRLLMSKVAQSALGVSFGANFHNLKADASDRVERIPTAKQVIFLYITGGMSQLDTFDPKPKHKELMGETKCIPTNVDGILVGDHLKKIAKITDRLAILNSMNTTTGSHPHANYIAHTGYDQRPDVLHPCLGSWVTKLSGRINDTLPGNVRIGGGSTTGAGFFESSHTPLSVRNPESGIQYSKISELITKDQYERRLNLLNKFNDSFVKQYSTRRIKDYSESYDAAVNLMKSEDLNAFDLNRESVEIRNAYGENSFGKGCLLARRLIERKVKFVEVNFNGWDHHFNIYDTFPGQARQMDHAVSSLILDLEQRGLLNETMVILTTEFGRTPEVTPVRKGRDHYPKAYSTVLAGGGIKGGQIYGKTDDKCSQILENPVKPFDISATMGLALGLPIKKEFISSQGVKFTLANKGTPLYSLF